MDMQYHSCWAVLGKKALYLSQKDSMLAENDDDDDDDDDDDVVEDCGKAWFLYVDDLNNHAGDGRDHPSSSYPRHRHCQ